MGIRRQELCSESTVLRVPRVEWHDNHHEYPISASNGFLPGQIDIAFQIIKLMHRTGIVESYIDARALFERVLSRGRLELSNHSLHNLLTLMNLLVPLPFFFRLRYLRPGIP